MILPTWGILSYVLVQKWPIRDDLNLSYWFYKKDTMAWVKRIAHELRSVQDNNEFQLKPIGDSMNELEAKLRGPSETPFEDGVFTLHIQIPS